MQAIKDQALQAEIDDEQIEDLLENYSDRVSNLVYHLLKLNEIYEDKTSFSKQDIFMWLSLRDTIKIRGKHLVNVFTLMIVDFVNTLELEEDNKKDELIEDKNFTCVDCQKYTKCKRICYKIAKMLPQLMSEKQEKKRFFQLGYYQPTNFMYYKKENDFIPIYE